MPASSSKDPYLLEVFRGSFWPLGGLFSPPFFLGLLVFWELGRDAAGFNGSAAFTHAPATFPFPARALRRGAEVPELTPSVGAQNWTLTQPQGSKSDAWGKIWVQHRETRNSCPLATRTLTVPGRRTKPTPTSPRKPGYRSIPIRDCQKHK